LGCEHAEEAEAGELRSGRELRFVDFVEKRFEGGIQVGKRLSSGYIGVPLPVSYPSIVVTQQRPAFQALLQLPQVVLALELRR